MKSLIFSFLLLAYIPTISSAAESDSEIKQKIIQESLESYSGNCPCPYNTAKNGTSCGKRSAYSRPGGYAPICYDRDVSADMIARYKLNHKVE